MSRWFRHYAGLTTDPKFGGVARRSKASRERVVFVWCCLLESAAEVNEGGRFAIDADSIADVLSCETAEVQAILDQMEASGLLADSRVGKWADRQFESDTSASRTRRYREKKRHGDDTVTSRDGGVTPPETETETDTELALVEPPEPLPEKPETDTRTAASRSVPGASRYFFESGVIRLTQPDFLKWEAAFPNISLRSELTGLTGWAGEQANWFFAVPGALAKREREARLAAEQFRLEAKAKAEAPRPKPYGYVP
ncbi:hypothetical protein FPV16_20560 [Methylobacterium sp. W2]|uniref:hypothetical protein n=1 Tax=Methylobacterium sp. W2 TaxID=2598107 RepID=UPI001D0C9B7E|nr:hypothetical protein [Methylobacterium sp. W2]MCC0808569.1 hypothetical protein [Methylobacterium sp. W2]